MWNFIWIVTLIVGWLLGWRAQKRGTIGNDLSIWILGVVAGVASQHSNIFG
jgi:hypothetical protein